MKIYSNDKLIKRNHLVGNVTSILSLVVLGGGMYLSFKDTDGSYLVFTFAALIIGFLLFQFSNYFTARWGRSPRPDEKITQALKGLDDKYSLYHYTTPVSHLLVGPAGVICLLPYNQPGVVRYDPDKDRWKQSGGNFFLRIFGGENIGKPENDARYAVSDAVKFLEKRQFNADQINPEPILVFINEKVGLDAAESPVPAVRSEKLKEFIRKRIKDKPIAPELLLQIQDALKQ